MRTGCRWSGDERPAAAVGRLADADGSLGDELWTSVNPAAVEIEAVGRASRQAAADREEPDQLKVVLDECSVDLVEVRVTPGVVPRGRCRRLPP
jgi:hypothetical protein